MILPRPQCELGYPEGQVKEILAAFARSEDDLWRFMRGQTMSVCSGSRYDYEAKVYRPSGCGPHGGIIYVDDMRRFLGNLPIAD